MIIYFIIGVLVNIFLLNRKWSETKQARDELVEDTAWAGMYFVPIASIIVVVAFVIIALLWPLILLKVLTSNPTLW